VQRPLDLVGELVRPVAPDLLKPRPEPGEARRGRDPLRQVLVLEPVQLQRDEESLVVMPLTRSCTVWKKRPTSASSRLAANSSCA
jgi:hypothetical protein